MTIAILDDGVSLHHFPDLMFQMMIDKGEVKSTTDDSLAWYHGSTCAAIIHRYAPDAQIGSIQVLDKKTGKGNAKNLIAALYWCANNDITIIHASLGTIAAVEDFQAVQNAVNDLYARGVVIISACKNGQRWSCPASLTNVIGVKCANDLHDDQYKMNPDVLLEGIDFIASADHTFPFSRYEVETSWTTQKSNSYAAPLITAKVYLLLTAFPKLGLDEIKARLAQQASEPAIFPPFYCNLDWASDFSLVSWSNSIIAESPKRTIYVNNSTETGGQDEEAILNWIRQIAVIHDIVLLDPSHLSQLEGRTHKRVGIPCSLWSHVPLPTEPCPLPLIWIAEDVPVSYCQAVANHFMKNSYAPLLLSQHYEDVETGWFPMPPNTPNALERALALAELRHMEVVIIRAASMDVVLSQGAIIPDVVLSAEARNRLLWAAMEQENNMWISSLDGTAEEVSGAIYNALTHP